MNTVKITSLAEYILFIEKLPQGVYLSRGQEKDLPLLPSAMRRDEYNMSLYSSNERDSFIEDFKINSAQYVDSSHFNKYEMLVYAQHFGVPTCLLDFTYSHLISAMFAVANAFSYPDDDNSNSVIWIIDPTKLNEKSVNCTEIINISSEDKLNLLDKNQENKYPFVITAKKNNPRIAAQNGLFVYFPKEIPLENLDISDDILRKIIIPHSCGRKILKSLFIMGMRFVDIYPELSSIAKDILLKKKVKQYCREEEDNDE